MQLFAKFHLQSMKISRYRLPLEQYLMALPSCKTSCPGQLELIGIGTRQLARGCQGAGVGAVLQLGFGDEQLAEIEREADDADQAHQRQRDDHGHGTLLPGRQGRPPVQGFVRNDMHS